MKHDFPELTKRLFAQLSDSHAQPFSSSGSSGLMAGVLVLVFQVSSGSQRNFSPRIYLSALSLLPILIALET